MDQVIPRRDLRHDTAEFFMLGNLRRDFAREQVRAALVFSTAQNGYSGFVARSLQGQDRFHKWRDAFRRVQ
jgi:hypothetical protein